MPAVQGKVFRSIEHEERRFSVGKGITNDFDKCKSNARTVLTTVETRKFVYLGGSVIRELNASDQVVKEYMRGLDLGGGIGGIIYQKKSSDYYYYHYNHKGDIVALTDGNGSLAAFYEYDAWGNVMTEAEKSGVDNPYRYSTKEWNEKSGLYYFGARYYCPEIGRWTQRDPAGTVDGLNLYAYALNSPSSMFDEWGEAAGFPPKWGEDPELCAQLNRAKERIVKSFKSKKKGRRPPRLPRSKLPGCLANVLETCVQDVVETLNVIPGTKSCLRAIEALKPKKERNNLPDCDAFYQHAMRCAEEAPRHATMFAAHIQLDMEIFFEWLKKKCDEAVEKARCCREDGR